MKKTYDSKFKSRVALEALRGELTMADRRESNKSRFRLSSVLLASPNFLFLAVSRWGRDLILN